MTYLIKRFPNKRIALNHKVYRLTKCMKTTGNRNCKRILSHKLTIKLNDCRQKSIIIYAIPRKILFVYFNILYKNNYKQNKQLLICIIV